MKKIFLISFTFIMCCITCSCSENEYKPLTAYEVGPYEYVSEANHTAEVTYKTEFYQDNKLIKNRDVEVFGESYSVQYQETRIVYDYDGQSTETEIYKYSGDTYSISVHFDKKTGEITAWHRYEKKYENNGEIKSEEVCLQIARDYLAEYVDDIDEYELVRKNSTSTSYDFDFYRYIGGMKMRDIASIRVRNNGEVCSVDIECAGSMRDADLPDEVVLSEVRNNVDAKLEAIYEDMYNRYTVTYGKREEMMLAFSDGSYAIECKVTANIVPKNISEESISETSTLIIFLD